MNQDYGKDEDSSEALLKKHEALVSDLEAFGNTIQALREQAKSCKVSRFKIIHADRLQLITIEIICTNFSLLTQSITTCKYYVEIVNRMFIL